MEIILILAAAAVTLSACTDAEKVSRKISRQADSFSIVRRFTCINARTDKVLLEMVGTLSVQRTKGDIDIIVRTGADEYKKHFIRLNEWTLYVVEDISGADLKPYYYEIKILPGVE